MTDIAVSGRIGAKNHMGRFIHEFEMSTADAVKDLVEEGANLARTYAPVGTKPDPRTVPLKDSIYTKMRGRTAGEWGSFARHALSVEKGARPHPIYGSPGLKFYWEERGRWFVPAEQFYNEPGKITVVNHPGNEAQPFLGRAYDEIKHRALQVMRKRMR